MQAGVRIFLFCLMISNKCGVFSEKNIESGIEINESSIADFSPDTAKINSQRTFSLNQVDTIPKTKAEKTLIELSIRILKAIKGKNYSALAEFVHPLLGVRCSPSGNIDIKNDQLLSRKKLLSLGESQTKIKWLNDFEGGKPIRLSIKDYFKKYVYDADFLKANKRSVNKTLGTQTTTLNNLAETYPRCNFTEFHFSGFDPKAGGMDWKSLRLVFKNYKKHPYLIAIIHDKWEI